MKLCEIHRQQVVGRPIQEVFAFFSVPENLARVTPPAMAFRVLTPSPVAMRRGTLIDYVVRVAGIPLRWRSLITAFEPPHLFVDEQLRGPYDFWHHTHRFEEHQGGTLIADHVLYALPLGPLGRLAHALFVRRQLRALFDFRARMIESLFPRRA